jgi:NTP pyrophosphatase (non-canonical NTP hydrolase)
MDWTTLLAERNEWVAHNFPNPHVPNPGESILGIMEEVGELSHAYLKSAQNIRGDRTQHEEDAKDAVADITIYLLGVMNIYGLPSDNLLVKLNTKDMFEALMYLGKATGELCSSSADLPDEYAMEKIISACEEICKHMDWEYETLVWSTWWKVKQRDWAAYPETGYPPVEEKIQEEPVDTPPGVNLLGDF